MKILILAEVELVEKDKSDFEHSNSSSPRYWRFVDRRFADNKYSFQYRRHIDCIDNDYTGEEPPFYACLYYGDIDVFSVDVYDGAIIIDGDVCFVHKSYKGERKIDADTKYLPKSVDLDVYAENYEYNDFCRMWLTLYKVFGQDVMENAAACTTGNNIYYEKIEIEKLLSESTLYLEHIKFLKPKIWKN